VNRGINEEPLWVHYTPQRRKLVWGKEEREREGLKAYGRV